MRRVQTLATRLIDNGAQRVPKSFLPVARFGLNVRSFSTELSKPTACSLSEARKMPRQPCEMENETLLHLAYNGHQDACEERLIREIMTVDEIEWDEANTIMETMKADNKSGMGIITLPYKFGLFTAVGAGAASLPMVFSLDTALWFNEDYVTTDVPDPRDLETFLEVGSWTWNWMEPPLGTISFVLLCLQFSRNQLTNLGWQPYTDKVKRYRATRLSNMYPKYDKQIVSRFAIGDSWA